MNTLDRLICKGKRVDTLEWIEGYYLPHKVVHGRPLEVETEDNIYDIKHFISCSGVEFEVVPETIRQFTGLCDKNGTKIFEGDIVEFETSLKMGYSFEIKDIWKNVTRHKGALGGFYYTRKDQAIVEFYRKTGMWELKVYNNGRYKRKSKLFTFRDSGYVVIGNIHDNPELLEVER